MPDLSTKVLAAALPPLVIHSQTAAGAGTVSGAAWFPAHALSWVCFVLEVTLTDAVVGDTLAVTIEDSHNGTTWFPWARFQNVLGNTAEPDYQLYQGHREWHADGIISNANLVAALAAGADHIGVAATDRYLLPQVRATGVIAGATPSFTYRVLMYGGGA